MWFYLEFALFVFGFLLAYRAGWKNGWHAAFSVAKRAVAELARQQAIEELKPKRKVEPSPLSKEEKMPLDD